MYEENKNSKLFSYVVFIVILSLFNLYLTYDARESMQDYLLGKNKQDQSGELTDLDIKYLADMLTDRSDETTSEEVEGGGNCGGISNNKQKDMSHNNVKEI